MKKLAAAVLALVALGLAGCSTDADVASENLSKAADQFEINRRIIFYNGITDRYMLTIEGKCAINHQDHSATTSRTWPSNSNRPLSAPTTTG